MSKHSVIITSVFWIAFLLLLSICCFYMIHNAAWIVGDEAIVYGTIGMGNAFSPLGFDGMIESGRFYPFAYNLYNILLLFGGERISPRACYVLQSIALCIYAICFVFVGLHLSKNESPIWKYAITFCFVSTTIFRVYPEFVTCYTGAWIIFMLLAIFVLCTCKFEESENWKWGIPAIISVTYICYCYENMCVIPLTYGLCSLLFNFKQLSCKKKWFNGLLITSAVIFLVLYVLIVIPHASHFYSHPSNNSTLVNATKMFIAHKIYWLAIVFLFVRLWELLKNKRHYVFADSFLLTSFAFFCGTALIQLDYTYYYNLGALLALTAILYYCCEYVKPFWTLLIFFSFFMLYGSKMPLRIKNNQKARINTYTHICQLTNRMNQGDKVYWYSPEYHDPSDFNVDLRNCQYIRLLTYLEWLEQRNIYIPENKSFQPDLHGIWLNPVENDKLFPDSASMFRNYKLMYNICGINAYSIE